MHIHTSGSYTICSLNAQTLRDSLDLGLELRNIHDSDPDVIAVQELVDDDKEKLLRAFFTDYTFVVPDAPRNAMNVPASTLAAALALLLALNLLLVVLHPYTFDDASATALKRPVSGLVFYLSDQVSHILLQTFTPRPLDSPALMYGRVFGILLCELILYIYQKHSRCFSRQSGLMLGWHTERFRASKIDPFKGYTESSGLCFPWRFWRRRGFQTVVLHDQKNTGVAKDSVVMVQHTFLGTRQALIEQMTGPESTTYYVGILGSEARLHDPHIKAWLGRMQCVAILSDHPSDTLFIERKRHSDERPRPGLQ